MGESPFKALPKVITYLNPIDYGLHSERGFIFFRLNRCGVLGYCKGETFLRMKQEKNTKRAPLRSYSEALRCLKKSDV